MQQRREFYKFCGNTFVGHRVSQGLSVYSTLVASYVSMHLVFLLSQIVPQTLQQAFLSVSAGNQVSV